MEVTMSSNPSDETNDPARRNFVKSISAGLVLGASPIHARELLMTRDEKLQFAWSFWQLQSEGRMEDALALLDDAGVYRPNGMQSWEDIPMHEVKRFFRIMGERMPLKFEYLDAVVENNQVVLEFTCYAQIPNGGGI